MGIMFKTSLDDMTEFTLFIVSVEILFFCLGVFLEVIK